MSHLRAAIDVAAEYAAHLHRADGVPKRKAILVGAAAVIRVARTNPSRFVPHRKSQESGLGFDSSTIMGVGSVLSAVGWIRKLVTGG